jgi:hypothetical protein
MDDGRWTMDKFSWQHNKVFNILIDSIDNFLISGFAGGKTSLIVHRPLKMSVDIFNGSC